MGRPFRLAVLNSHPIQYFAPLYQRIAQEPGIDLTVYYCSRQGAEKYLDEGFGRAVQWDIPLLDGYNHVFLPNRRKHDQVSGFTSLINPAIVGAVRRNRPNALWVHGHSYASYILGIAAARTLGIPVLMRCETHQLLSRSRAKQLLRRPLMTAFYRTFVRAGLPIGRLNREFYLAHGLPATRLFTVPYTVDNHFFMEATQRAKAEGARIRATLGIADDKPAILFASKLIPRKRPFDLLEAYRQLRETGAPAQLLFVGSGEEETALRAYVAEQQIPDVHFFGFRNQSELPEFYSVADLFVLPSVNEPWGLIINEVMCAELPVVASREIGAVADLVREGYNGFTYDAGNVPQLAMHLQTLVTDPKLCKQMGAHSRELIQEWNFDRCVEGLHQAIAYLRAEAPAVAATSPA